jgi:hypothetical protein
MKRVAVIILCALGVLSSVCFGQNTGLTSQKGGTPPPVLKKTVVPLEIKGTIDTITLPEAAKGIRPEISLLGADGKRYVFLVRSTTTIYGPDWKAISIDKLVKGQQVRVQYITNKDGFLVAQSIKPVSEQGMKAPQ